MEDLAEEKQQEEQEERDRGFDWYQGQIDEDGRPNGQGVFIRMDIPELSVGYFSRGSRLGKYKSIRCDGNLFEGTFGQMVIEEEARL